MLKSDKIMDSRAAAKAKAALLRGSVLVKYKPSKGSNSRLIKLVKTAEDPLQPPKFRYRKIPRAGRDSPPPVVLHSPPRQLTAEDIRNWNVPPCVSMWKNKKGYTIPLDKRQAQSAVVLEPKISHRMVEVAYALYAAEDKIREEIDLCSKMRRETEMRETERRDLELRNLARRAREECGGGKRKRRMDGGGEERKKKKTTRSRREGGGLGESARRELLFDRSLADAYGHGDGDGEREEVKTVRKMRERGADRVGGCRYLS